MTSDDLAELWKVDGKIDEIDVPGEVRKIPLLHHKYYSIYLRQHRKLRELRARARTLEHLKCDYYEGVLDEDTLEELGWEQWDRKILRQDLKRYVDNDKDVIRLSLLIGEQEELVSFCEDIIKSINNRNFLLKNIIEFERFTSGQ